MAFTPNALWIVESFFFPNCKLKHSNISLYLFSMVYSIYLEGIVLKTSMAVPGKSAVTFASTRPEDIAKATVTALCRSVPPAVPGVAFLSGGQTEEQVNFLAFVLAL